jgi:hypothetical protein
VEEHEDMVPERPEPEVGRYPDPEPEPVPEVDADSAVGSEPETAEKPANMRRRVILGVLLSVIVFLLVLPVFSTLQPGYYARYPGMRDRMDAWAGSTHARMSCISCHVEPGVKGFLSFSARSIPAFYSQLINGANETNLLEMPTRKACQKCHTDYRQVSPNGDLLIPHRAHVEVLGVNCVVCHKDLVHTANEQGFNRPEMETCLTLCHDGVKATNKCVKCHTRKEVPETHQRKDWLKVHGTMSTTAVCGKCHSWTPDYCNDCHKIKPATHVGNWKKNHATRAKENGKGCLVCHNKKTFCGKCH